MMIWVLLLPKILESIDIVPLDLTKMSYLLRIGQTTGFVTPVKSSDYYCYQQLNLKALANAYNCCRGQTIILAQGVSKKHLMSYWVGLFGWLGGLKQPVVKDQ